MTIEIFLGGAEHGDVLRANFHLGSLFTSEVEVGEGGTSFSSFFLIFCQRFHTIFAANQPSRHQWNSRKF